MARADNIGKFVRVKEVAQAHVCKDVPPESLRKKKQDPMPVSSLLKKQKVILEIPDEYAYALMDMYGGKGLQYAIMHLIRKHVTPIDENSLT